MNGTVVWLVSFGKQETGKPWMIYAVRFFNIRSLSKSHIEWIDTKGGGERLNVKKWTDTFALKIVPKETWVIIWAPLTQPKK